MNSKKAKKIRKAVYGDHSPKVREYVINRKTDVVSNSIWSLRYAYLQCKRTGRLI